MTTPTRTYVEVPANSSLTPSQQVAVNLAVNGFLICVGAALIACTYKFFFGGTTTTTKTVARGGSEGGSGGRANRTSSTTSVTRNNTQGYFVGGTLYDRVYFGGSYGYWGPGNVFFVEGSPMFWGQVDNSRDFGGGFVDHGDTSVEQGGGFVDQDNSRDSGGGFVDQDNSPASQDNTPDFGGSFVDQSDTSSDSGGGFVDQDNSPAQYEAPDTGTSDW